MSYDLTLKPVAGASLPSDADVREWLSTQKGWGVYGWGTGYRGEHTGTQLMMHRDEDAQALALSMSGNAAHVVGPDLVRQVRALVDRFGLEVSDPQMEGMGDGPLDESKLLAGWTFYNGFSTKTAHGWLGQPVPPHLPAAKLEAAVAWNTGRSALERDDLFVPAISYLAAEGGLAETFVAWVGGEGLLPVVDVLVTPLAQVGWSMLASAVEGRAPLSDPAPHHRIDAELAAQIDALIANAAPSGSLPRLVPPSEVRTTEVVAPYLGSIETSTDKETLASAAMLAHQTHDRKKAFAAARRLVELDPDSHTGAVVGAINGLYLAEYADAERLVERIFAINPGDSTGHIVRCALRTELGRHEEAVADADAALAGERSAMVVNMKAFALAAAGRDDEARAAYQEALALIDAELAASPDDAEIVSRRAYALVGLGRHEEAEKVAERALSLPGETFLTLQSLGRARVALGKHAAAIEALEAALQQRERAPMASHYLGIALRAVGREEDARAAFADASISPHFRALAAV